MRLASIMRPVPLLWLSAALSLGAWLLPGESTELRGFNVRADTSIMGWVLLLAWYSLCALVIVVGEAMGSKLKPPRSIALVETEDLYGRRLMLLLMAVGALGVLVTYRDISSVVSIRDALTSQSGNELSEALGSGAGLQSLRYATIPAAALAMFRLTQGRREPLFLMGGIALLLLNATVTSRLSLVMCAVVVLFMITWSNPQRRIRLRTLIVVAVVAFIALGWMNYVRNANYYQANGVSSPAMMNVYQIATYLGAPTQAAVGVSTSVMDGEFSDSGRLETPTQLLVPSFLQDETGDKSRLNTLDRYGATPVAPNLNTNSVFADTFVDRGWTGLLAALSGLFLVAMIFGHFAQYRGAMLLGAGVALYPVVEWWRTYLVNQGIFIFILLAITGLGWVAAVWTHTAMASRRGAPHRVPIGSGPEAPEGASSEATPLQRPVPRPSRSPRGLGRAKARASDTGPLRRSPSD